MCDCDIINRGMIKKEDIFVEDAYKKYGCQNIHCTNNICENCAIICNCCDNSICTPCAALCEIGSCTTYICIPKIKKYDSNNNIYYEYNYDANPCWTGCGRKYICLDHRCHLYDEDLVICINCEEDSEYICKCGCFDQKIYKNCEVKCQVREDCTNYIKSNHMLENNCDTCSKVIGRYQYSCIDCFIIIDDKKYCVNCVKNDA